MIVEKIRAQSQLGLDPALHQILLLLQMESFHQQLCSQLHPPKLRNQVTLLSQPNLKFHLLQLHQHLVHLLELLLLEVVAIDPDQESRLI